MLKKFVFLFFVFLILNPLYAQEIKSVNFLQEGEVSKLVIEVSKEVVAERFSVTEDKQIILDLKNVKAERKVLRPIDTSEFEGASVFISGYQKPGSPEDIRFAIQLRDNVRSILETSENKIILSIENRFGVFSKTRVAKSDETVKAIEKEVVEDDLKMNVPKSASIEDILENLTFSGPKKYIGKRISINVKDIAIPELLKMIADTSGFNIIIDKDVSGAPPLTLSLTNIPWDQALDTILQLSRLVATKNSNILSVKTVAQATSQAQAEVEAANVRRGLEPLVTKVFMINYSDLGSLTAILADYITPQRGAIKTDDRTNSIIVKDTVDAIERIKKVIEVLDTQTPQILIEAKVVEASEQYAKSIGLNSGVNASYEALGDRVVNESARFNIASAPGVNSNNSFLSGTFGIKRLTNLAFSLDLMERESKGRIVSSPKVITQNRRAATITSSEQRYFNQTTMGQGVAITTPAAVAASINLSVTPQVTNDGAINMAVTVSKQSFDSQVSANLLPTINSRNINTNVLVDNGSTIVIGGLYSTDSAENHSGVPWLKDIPLLGWLFRTPYNPSTKKSELIIFLTPRIINQDEAGFSQSKI